MTWNFIVIWVLLWVKHERNKNMPFLFGKMVAAGLVNAAFYHIPGPLEALWTALQTLFHMQGDLREWRFRITLDQYSIFPGMVCAVLFMNWSSYSIPKSPLFPSARRMVYAISVTIMLGYAYFEATQPSKQVYNQKHTYVSWLPCCAFVILRNSTSWLRRTHNKFFAWVGRGSLETFLLQFHIWLGADTAGLINVPGLAHQRVLTAVIMTVIFLWVSALVTSATGGVIEWIMLIEMPGLPTSAPKAPNGKAAFDEKPVEPKAPNGLLDKGDDLEKSEKSSTAGSSGGSDVMGLLGKARSDLRVRVALILGAMAFMNWVSASATTRGPRSIS